MAGGRGGDGDDEVARPTADWVDRHLQVAAVVLDQPQRVVLEGREPLGGHQVADDALDVHRRPTSDADMAGDSTTTSSGFSWRSSSGGGSSSQKSMMPTM